MLLTIIINYPVGPIINFVFQQSIPQRGRDDSLLDKERVKALDVAIGEIFHKLINFVRRDFFVARRHHFAGCLIHDVSGDNLAGKLFFFHHERGDVSFPRRLSAARVIFLFLRTRISSVPSMKMSAGAAVPPGV